MDETAVHEFLSCPSCRHDGLAPVVFARDAAGIVDGVIMCTGCREWYRVEDRVPELLLPPLRNESRRLAFREKFHGRWDGWDLPGAGTPSSEAHGAELKLEQARFFNGQAPRYDRGITDSPFWVAVDRRFLTGLAADNSGGGILVEAGAGTGWSSAGFAERFRTVLSFDLSEEMTREATRKDSGNGPGRIHRFMADAERIPLRAGIADCLVFCGVLCLFEFPETAIAEAVRILRTGGTVMGYDANRSALRGAFDLLMRLSPSWTHKSWPAGNTVSQAILEGWFSSAGISAGTWTAVFVPPQILNMAGPGRAGKLMRFTDKALGAIPWVRRQGGLVFFAGRKPPA